MPHMTRTGRITMFSIRQFFYLLCLDRHATISIRKRVRYVLINAATRYTDELTDLFNYGRNKIYCVNMLSFRVCPYRPQYLFSVPVKYPTLL